MIYGFNEKKEKVPILDLGFPVGAIFLSVNSANPSTYLGGTWVQIKDTFLLACGDIYEAGDEGGEAEVTLTGAQSGVKAHTHGFTQPQVTLGSHTHRGSNTGEYFVMSDNPSAWNTRVAYNSDGSVRVNSTHNDDYSYHNRTYTSSTDLGTKTATGGAVQTKAAENASEAHNNMPPYLAVYVWQRTA